LIGQKNLRQQFTKWALVVLWICLACISLAVRPASAQIFSNPVIEGAGAPSGACPERKFYFNTSASTVYACVNGAWAEVSGVSGGVSPPPLVSSLTWINQGTSTASNTSAGIFFNQPYTSSNYVAALLATAPATPYTFTVGIESVVNFTSSTADSLCISDGTKIETVGWAATTTAVTLELVDWTNYDTFSASSSLSPSLATLPNILWLREADNGTNRTYGWSYDGVNFIQLTQISDTSFLTPTKIGVCTAADTDTNGAYMTVVSWSQ
jgi:hypothetical protein